MGTFSDALKKAKKRKSAAQLDRERRRRGLIRRGLVAETRTTEVRSRRMNRVLKKSAKEDRLQRRMGLINVVVQFDQCAMLLTLPYDLSYAMVTALKSGNLVINDPQALKRTLAQLAWEQHRCEVDVEQPMTFQPIAYDNDDSLLQYQTIEL